MNKKIWLIVIFLVLIIILAISLIAKDSSNNNVAAGPPDAAIQVVKQYVQARENNVGANQATPTSWLIQVKPITTATWFNTLQPKTTTTTNVDEDYRTAHSNKYDVRANVADCIWNHDIMAPTSSAGVISCSVSDDTVDESTGSVVPASSTPFGWIHVGRQLPALLSVVKQNGKWLIKNDLTAQGS